MKKMPACICLLYLLFFHSVAFSTAMSSYEQIINTAYVNRTCLTLDNDLRSVSLQPCVNTDAQQWIFGSAGSRYFIESKTLGESAQKICISVVTNDRLLMAACPVSSIDYRANQLWSRDINNPSLLSNKLITDQGREDYLQSNADGQLIFGIKEEDSANWTITQPVYEEIINTVYKTGNKTEQCLTLGADLTSVALQACLGKDEQHWLFTPSGSRLLVTNKALDGLAQKMCLFAEDLTSEKPVKMAACAGSGGSDYQSRRLWSRDGSNPSLLSNKYIGDMLSANYLHANTSGQLVFGSKEEDSAAWSIAKRYGYIRNVEKGQDTCLTLSQNNIDLEFAPCEGVARQDWRMSLLSQGYDKLTNRALAGGEEQCLGSNAKMIDCDGDGLTSERSWNYNNRFAPTLIGFTLGNKYRNDLGKKELLGFSGSTIQMVPAYQSNAVTWSFELQVPPSTRRQMVGDKKVLLLHAKYSDKPETDFVAVQQGFFGTPDDGYSFTNAVHASAGTRLHFTGDAVTGLDLGPTPSDCPSTALKTKAIEEARKKGFDANNYDYVAVEIPPTACTWVGLAAQPGPWAMANGVGWKPWVWQHEFGHSLGGAHATSLEHCSIYRYVVQVGGNECTVTRTGDPSDTLGGGGSRLYPIPYLYYAGWLTDEQFPEVTKNGTYKIAPLFGDTATAGVKGLRILRSDGSYLTLEFRQPLTHFENWPVDDPFVNGLIVRIARFNSNLVSNTLVDATPGSQDGMKDAPLEQGGSIADLLSGRQITVTHIDQTGATVFITDIQNNQFPEHWPVEQKDDAVVVED